MASTPFFSRVTNSIIEDMPSRTRGSEVEISTSTGYVATPFESNSALSPTNETVHETESPSSTSNDTYDDCQRDILGTTSSSTLDRTQKASGDMTVAKGHFKEAVEPPSVPETEEIFPSAGASRTESIFLFKASSNAFLALSTAIPSGFSSAGSANFLLSACIFDISTCADSFAKSDAFFFFVTSRANCACETFCEADSEDISPSVSDFRRFAAESSSLFTAMSKAFSAARILESLAVLASPNDKMVDAYDADSDLSEAWAFSNDAKEELIAAWLNDGESTVALTTSTVAESAWFANDATSRSSWERASISSHSGLPFLRYSVHFA